MDLRRLCGDSDKGDSGGGGQGGGRTSLELVDCRVDGQLWAAGPPARPAQYSAAGLEWNEGPSAWGTEDEVSSDGLDEMVAATEALRSFPPPEQLLGGAAAAAAGGEDFLLGACRNAVAAAGGERGPAAGDLQRLERCAARLRDTYAAIRRLANASGIELPFPAGDDGGPPVPDWLQEAEARHRQAAAVSTDSDESGDEDARELREMGEVRDSLNATLQFLQWMPDEDRGVDEYRLMAQIPDALARAQAAEMAAGRAGAAAAAPP